MPLAVLLPVVVLGIVGIGVLLHLTGQSRTFEIPDEPTARREFARHWPEARVLGVDLAAGAALVLADVGPVLLRPFGADTVALRVRALEPVAKGLRLRFDGLAAPPVTVPMDAPTRARWLSLGGHHANVS